MTGLYYKSIKDYYIVFLAEEVQSEKLIFAIGSKERVRLNWHPYLGFCQRFVERVREEKLIGYKYMKLGKISIAVLLFVSFIENDIREIRRNKDVKILSFLYSLWGYSKKVANGDIKPFFE